MYVLMYFLSPQRISSFDTTNKEYGTMRASNGNCSHLSIVLEGHTNTLFAIDFTASGVMYISSFGRRTPS